MNHPKIVLPSEQFLLVTEVIGLISLLILIATYCVLLWVCLTKSPAPMSGYKWWLVINGTISVLFETYFTLITPIVLLPYPMLLLDGLVGRNFTFSDFALELYGELLLFFVALIAFVTMTVFLFRYCQTTDNLMYKVVFSSRKISILLFTVVILILGLMAFIPCHLLVMPPQMLLADIYEA
ncbi:serpentine type 7TM GPCR chemoreceptor srh domain-containing protein [Ditylenchus destructor]|nr:serpentine type 7TM GPCR chemoreceptor srh domain-containing protein [Ditylenchus destructor]